VWDGGGVQKLQYMAVPVRSDGTQPQNGLSYKTTSESSLEKMRKADSGRLFDIIILMGGIFTRISTDTKLPNPFVYFFK
jgi:hypothetical protein